MGVGSCPSSWIDLARLTVLLNNLGSIGHQLAELRNHLGTGHGRSTVHIGLPARRAKLVIGAAASSPVLPEEVRQSVYAQINSLKKGLVLDNKPEAGTLPPFER
jgi:hypothetical protein